MGIETTSFIMQYLNMCVQSHFASGLLCNIMKYGLIFLYMAYGHRDLNKMVDDFGMDKSELFYYLLTIGQEGDIVSSFEVQVQGHLNHFAFL